MLILGLKILIVLGTLSGIGYSALCLCGARWFLRRWLSAKGGSFRPPVSILKPLCGVDPNAYESLRSHCVQEYPDYEIIFGVNDPEDFAIPVVRRLMVEFPTRNIRLVVCPKFLGSNHKISNLIQMFPVAQHDYLLVNDSDICVPAEYLQQVMIEFQERRVGIVTCLYRGIAGSTLGGKLEALGISTDFIPGVLSAQLVEGGIHFALGSTLAFHRKSLESIGGFEAIVDYLGDDYEMGSRIAAAGYAVAIAESVVEHHLPDYSFRDYLRHQLRWARSTRDSRPKGYMGLLLTFGLPWAMLGVAVAPSTVWAWALLIASLTMRLAVSFTVALAVLKDRRVWNHFWLIPIRDVIAVGIWIISLTGRRIVWRGNEFRLENGKLRS